MEQNPPNQKPSESVIRFDCTFCGQKIRVPCIYAGKKAKCPKCKNVVIIPQSTPPHPSQEDKPIRLKSDSDFLAQTPRQSHPPKDDTTLNDEQQFQMLRDAAGLPPLEPPPPPKRKFPALIDIFLYPANAQGVIFLAIAVLVPILIRLIALFLCIFGLLFSLLNVVIGMYIYWFLAQCVRDSAAGNLRAPETMAQTPGIWELLWQIFELIACFALCAAPAAVYFGYTRRIDLPFWLVVGCGAFIYPMTLLAVIMFDSINGLNPLIIILSIFSTFFQYCGLVVLISAIIFLYVQTVRTIPPNLLLRMVLSPLIQAVELYLAMVAAHLLGRFYFRYQEKLNWEV
jgi:phage FluMu protein Com